MPIIKSAKKRVKITAKATARNNTVRRKLRDALKTFQAAVTSGKSAEINKARSEADSVIDTAAKKNIIHKNKAARKKAQLAKAAKAAGAKITPTAKKSAPKKAPASKKAVAKKPTAKKAKTTKK